MISLIYTYYNQPKMLQKQVENWKTWTNVGNLIELILVDDCSEVPMEIPELPFPVQAFRVLQDLFFNNPGAKNLGVERAKHSWVLITDMDYTFSERNILDLCSMSKEPETFYYFRAVSYRPHKKVRHPKSTMLMERRTFKNVGGFDEDFVGNYGKDTQQLYYCLRYHDYKEQCLPNIEIKQWMPTDISDSQVLVEKDNSVNTKLLNQKIAGEIPWIKDTIRFPWERLT